MTRSRPATSSPIACRLRGGTGGNDYRDNITDCNGTPVQIGDMLPIETGNMIGPTQHGMEDLIALDPSAHWDPANEVGHRQLRR